MGGGGLKVKRSPRLMFEHAGTSKGQGLPEEVSHGGWALRF